jgi:hypothetical protein
MLSAQLSHTYFLFGTVAGGAESAAPLPRTSALLGEEMNPAGVDPVEDDEAALRQAFFQAIGDVMPVVV